MVDLNQAIAYDVNERLLTAEQFQQLAEIPAELEWLANIHKEHTRKPLRLDEKNYP